MKTKTGKWLYCPKCKNKPDEIVEVYKEIREQRKWNEEGDYYEIEETDLGNPDYSECGECGTQLTEE